MQLRALALTVLAASAPARTVCAGGPTVDDTWRVAPGGVLAIDGGLVLGFPAALPTGLTTGVGGGFTCTCGTLAWGGRASWTRASESSTAWTVRHDELRLRAAGELRHVAGRGTVALRLDAGGTVIHELRTRNQGARAGLTGSDLETSAYALVPAADLEGVIAIDLAGRWGLVVSGGPTVAIVDGAAHAAWTAELGVTWRP